MKVINMVLRCAGCLIVLILLNSCAASKPTTIEPSKRNIRPMMKLNIETYDGQMYSIRVKRTDDNGIHSRTGKFISFSDIKHIERVVHSPGKVLRVYAIGLAAFSGFSILVASLAFRYSE